MERFQSVLLDVWREACRHIEIRESTINIAGLLARELPLAALLIRRADVAHTMLETVAVGEPKTHAPNVEAKTICTPNQWRKVSAWFKAGKVTHDATLTRSVSEDSGRKRAGEMAFLVPTGMEGDALAGPLVGEEGPLGVLVFVALPGKPFKFSHHQMIDALLEPFAVALENDRRLHELNALREAAEADRRSLLTRLGRENINETIVGADSGLRQVMQRAELVSQSDVPVLILGETGTGKEVVARAIHTRSARAAAPFIRVNCGAIPPELLDSQLFGHEKGSFTGASDTRKGWFERADGGTLFLDEMGELPLAAQVRLLRVLQDGFIERVGGQQPIRVDVRIVAATHRDLASMVAAGTFREDLWYRINVFPILLPRLRERLEDIPALARHFAQRAANRFGLAYVEPSADDLQALARYPWPGNIRELGAVIDRAAILGDGKRLDVSLALGFSGATPTAASTAPAATPVVSTDRASIVTLDEAQKQHIQRALAATHGRVEGKRGAAAILGINPHTLRARMRKLGLEWAKYREE
jgi:transcriptional regulator with GAF, ATPase, and Fis domain